MKDRHDQRGIRRLGKASLLAAVLLGLWSQPAPSHAQQYWDVNGAATGLGGAGNWDLTTTRWNDSTGVSVPSLWANTTSSSAVFSGTAGTVTLNTMNLTANALAFATTGYIISGSAASALTLAGTMPTIDVVSAGTGTFSTGVLAGNGGFTKTGTGTLALQSSSTLSGAVNVNAGTLSLSGPSGTLISASSVTVAQGAVLQLLNTVSPTNTAATNNNNDRLGNIDITLNGGTLNFAGYRGVTGTGTNESVGRLILGSGTSTVSLASSYGTTGASLGTLTFSNATSAFSRTTGATLDFVDNSYGDIIVTGLTSTNSIVGGWAVNTATTAGFLKSVNGSLQAYGSGETNYTTNGTSTTWSTTSNVDATGARSTVSSQTINSLNITGSGTARTITIAAGTTLTLASGGLIATGTTGHSLTGGTVTAGTAAGAELFVYNNLGFTISSVIGDNAAGTVNFVKSGAGTLTLSGTTANTFTGTSYINEGTVTMGKTSSVNALGSNVVVNGGTLNYAGTSDEQIGNTSTVNLNNGSIDFGARTETVGALNMAGGTLARGGANLALAGASSVTGGTLTFSASGSAITTGSTLALGGANFSYTASAASPTGGLILGGNVTYAATNTGVATFTNAGAVFGRIDLGGVTRAFTVTDSNTLAATVPEVQSAWVIANGALTKAGTGALALTAANTYTGGTTVSAGTLLVNNTAGSGTGTGAVAVNAGTLGGTGTMTGAVTVASGAILSPGAVAGTSIGKLTLGNSTTSPTMTLSGTYLVNLTGSAAPTAGTTYSQISVVGALTLNVTSSLLSVVALSNANLAVAQVLNVALNDGVDPVIGTFGTLTEGSTVTDNLGDTYTISYLANADAGALGNDIALTVSSVSPVPEPATVLGGLLLAVAAGWNQRHRCRVLANGVHRRSQACWKRD